MNESVMMIAAIAVFIGLYALLGVHLAHIWGVDPSRETPASERGRAGSAASMLLGSLACGAAPAALCGVSASELGMVGLLGLTAICTLFLGVLRFALLFVSVRHGSARLADIAAEELGTPARKPVHLLALLAALGALAGLLHAAAAWLDGAAGGSASQAAFFALSALIVQHVLVPADLQAARLRNEDEAAWLSMGHTLVLALIACISALLCGREAAVIAVLSAAQGERVMKAVCLAVFFPAAEQFAHLGGRALRGLFSRNTLVRKKDYPYTGLAAGLAALTIAAGLAAAVPGRALLLLSAVCALLLAIAALLCCALWFARIGRRMI